MTNLYLPNYSPWFGDLDFWRYYKPVEHKTTVVSKESAYVLYVLTRQAIHLHGSFYECGVWKGGMAKMVGDILRDYDSSAALRLFDTFTGHPRPDPVRDHHAEGDYGDVFVDDVVKLVEYSHAEIYPGLIPHTFGGLEEDQIALAHVNVELYQSTKDCCEWIYPRMLRAGFMIFDDYGEFMCQGAREAVDEFFADKPEVPLVLEKSTALVFKI